MNGCSWLLIAGSAYVEKSSRSLLKDIATARDPKETLALPQNFEHWSLTTLREKLVKTGAKVVRHGRYITFQVAEVAVPREPVPKNPEPDG